MKNISKKTTNTAQKSKLEDFTALSRKQLQIIIGGDDDPVTSRGTRTSSGIEGE